MEWVGILFCKLPVSRKLLLLRAKIMRNTFSNLWLWHNNRALDIGWSDNNSFYDVFCHPNGTSNYDVLLRGDSPTSGLGSMNNRWYHLEGSIEVQAITGVGSNEYNEIYGYDQGNSQPNPLIHTGGKLLHPTMTLYT